MRYVLALIGALLASGAHAASITLSIVIVDGSTALTCQLGPRYDEPVPAGATLCAVEVTPADWSGTLSLSGADAGLFALDGNILVVGQTPLAARDYNFNLVATP